MAVIRAVRAANASHCFRQRRLDIGLLRQHRLVFGRAGSGRERAAFFGLQMIFGSLFHGAPARNGRAVGTAQKTNGRGLGSSLEELADWAFHRKCRRDRP